MLFKMNNILDKEVLIALKDLVLVSVKAFDFTKDLFMKFLRFLRRLGAMSVFIPGIPQVEPGGCDHSADSGGPFVSREVRIRQFQSLKKL